LKSVSRGTRGGLVKVLVVDADSASRQQLHAKLREAGFETLDAATYEEGRRLWSSERPSVLIADIRLGQYNGLQLLLHARAAQPGIAALITCSFPDKVLEAETTRFGGTFFVKPLDMERVLGAIRQHRQAAPSQIVERRVADRRQIVVPGFGPDRRTADRRAIH
jgi:DNA-binding response OmpR family regulator